MNNIYDVEELNLELILKICVVLLVGAIGGKITSHFKLPNVSGYLLAGLLLGPSFLHYLNSGDIDSFTIISEFALGIIAFSIGNEFTIKEMSKLGKPITIITLAEVVGAVTVVFCVMYFLFNQSFAFSAVIAAMSASTAPAATLLIIRQFNAKGPLTKTILPVVALDDVFGIIFFGIAISLAKLSVGSQQSSLFKMFSGPFIEIGGSFLLGIVLGVFLSLISKKAKGRDEMQVTTLAAIGIASGLAHHLNLSPLLTCIMMGTTLVNLVHKPKRVFDSIDDFASPIYVLFFTLAGASLDISILTKVGLMGVAYIFARAAGKILGSWIGAKSVKSDAVVRKYLGLSLLPQGGVAIGLAVLVRQQLPEYATDISTIIMFSILVYELLGPIFAKIALQKAGEIDGGKERKELTGKNKKKPEIAC
jgi:Kef-type K+ transport system membrane component KefB